MWTCPRCKREFKRTNQSHYCGKAPQTVGEYIESQPAQTQDSLNEIRNILINSVPNVNERILWSMPFYEKNGNSVSFAACKNHISFYAGAEAIEKFSHELSGFATNKNAVYFPYDKQLPKEAVEKIAKWCLE